MANKANELYMKALRYKIFRKGDFNEFMQVLQEAAELGSPEAQHEMAKLYERGEGVQQDINKAITWYQKAAEQGYVGAQNSLVFLHINEAMRYAKMIAESDEKVNHYGPQARYYLWLLGIMHEFGLPDGYSSDLSEAAKWYTLATQKGGESTTRLGAEGLKRIAEKILLQ